METSLKDLPRVTREGYGRAEHCVLVPSDAGWHPDDVVDLSEAGVRGLRFAVLSARNRMRKV